jgi:uncharacterized protein (DUF983 family)
MHAIHQRPPVVSPAAGTAPRTSSLRRLRRRSLAILRQRCPACLAGAIFRSTFRILPACQVCGHRFERAPGFFRGALAVSAVLAAMTLLVLLGVMHRWLGPTHGEAFAILVAVLLFLLLVPAIFRYPRVIRAHRGIAPADRGQFTGRAPR